MRPAIRLLQKMPTNPGTIRALPFGPTGITGIGTHPAPRPTLMTIYSKTLEALKQLPKESAYRTATESMTVHRYNIINATKPFGWEQYLEELKSRGRPSPPDYTQGELRRQTFSGKEVTGMWMQQEGYGDLEQEDSGYKRVHEDAEKDLGRQTYKTENPGRPLPNEDIVNEPNLSVEQVQEIESQIGGGLIEEIIVVAYGEMQLVETMKENKVWEPLVEQPVEGQWSYFERKTA